MKTLTMMVGLPRSGKSTTARTLGAPIVNPDAVRLALHGQAFYSNAEPMVWAVCKLMVAALFEAGHDRVVLDATNGTRKRRDEWKDSRWKREYYHCPASAVECKERAYRNRREDLFPVIDRMSSSWEPVQEEELE